MPVEASTPVFFLQVSPPPGRPPRPLQLGLGPSPPLDFQNTQDSPPSEPSHHAELLSLPSQALPHGIKQSEKSHFNM